MTDGNNTERRGPLAKEFWEAINSMDLAKVRSLLAQGCDPDVWGYGNRFGDLPLQAAARVGGDIGLAVVKALVKSGADIDHRGDQRSTALHRAVYEDRKDGWTTARFLVQSGADCALLDSDGLTPPEAANNHGNDDAVLAMLDSGMSPKVCGVAGSLLWYVAWDSPFLVETLSKRGCPADFTNGVQTPLARAIESFIGGEKSSPDVAQVIRTLVNAGADLNRIDGDPLAVVESLLLDEALVQSGQKGKDWKDRVI
jgi:hypothetical protein